MKRFFLSLMCAILCTFITKASVTIQQVAGWFESGYVTWSAVTGASNYNVYVAEAGSSSWTQLDKELVRQYPDYYRADAVGLKAGTYRFKIEPVGAESQTTETSTFTVTAHDRSGFAHVGMDEGIGAYKNDGTLKDGAKVLYVWADNAKTISCEMQTSNTATETRTGLQSIVSALEKTVTNRTPLAIRIIGTIKATDMDSFGSSKEGLQVKGKGSSYKGNVTIEGIGDDATIWGFGILCRSISSVEFRNFAIMLCMDDCLSLDTDNKHVWIHNMDFFYGGTGGDADQAKGDGTVDIKGQSSHVTVSYNHFFDSGKCSLGGMKSETTDCWMSYHHNWFDHSDSRHPRIRTCFYYVYNNYYDGNSKYGVGVTSGGSAFVEANYFRNCKYPMLISKQGTDAEGEGTFSGEAGGVIKAFNNYITGAKKIQYYDGSQTDGKWDAVKVDSRSATVSATCLSGATGYNNTADAAARSAVPSVDAPETVPATVTGALGAGRMNHGDFKWTFLNSVQDANYGVITELKTALQNYKSTLVGFAGGSSVSNGGADSGVDGGDGSGVDQTDPTDPSWGGDSGMSDDGGDEYGMPYIANTDGTDFFWFGENADQTNQWIANGVIVLTSGTATNRDGVIPSSIFNEQYAGNDTYQATHIGSLQLGQASSAEKTDGGYCTIYCSQGISNFKINTLRTGSTYFQVLKSEDGTTFTKVATISKQAAGIQTNDFTSDLKTSSPVWVRILNTSTGGLNIHGVLIDRPSAEGEVAPELAASDLAKVNTNSIALNLNGIYTLKAATDYTTSSTGAITFSSSKTSVATVDNTGKITAVAEGTATITLSQAADNTYKAGSIQFTVNVTDNRSASQLAVTSGTTVALKLGEIVEAQIVVTGNAGTVSYKSSKTSIATVDATGKITAVAEGTATITISDTGSDSVKPGSATVNVTVEAASTDPGTEPGGDDSGEEETPTADSDDVLCTFTRDSEKVSTGTTSSNMVNIVSGSYSTKGPVTYCGNSYVHCVKIESTTEIKITPSDNYTVVLVFDVASKKLKIDGTTCTTTGKGLYSFVAEKNKSYKLTKGDTMNLFAVAFVSMFGDTNGSKTITAADLTTIISGNCKAPSADMNIDGTIDQTDVEALVNKLLEKSNE